MIIYGINPVLEWLRSGRPVKEVYVIEKPGRALAGVPVEARRRGVSIKKITPGKIEKIAGTRQHQGTAALVPGGFPYCGLEEVITSWKASNQTALFLVLDSVQDPANLGALLRAAVAAGVRAVIIPTDRASPVTPAAIKASAGAAAYAIVVRVVNLARTIKRLKEEGLWTVAVEADAPEDIYSVDFTSHAAIVLGGEDEGIRRLVRESCDRSASIPMAGPINSLNVSQAGAVVLFEARRQRAAGQPVKPSSTS